MKLSDLNDHSKEIEKYFPNEPRVTFLHGADFYNKIYADSTMDLLTSSIAMHWLPHEMEWTGHVYPMSECVADSERIKRAKTVEKMWTEIVHARAQELKPGGILIMANAANFSDDPFGQEYSGKTLFDVINKISVEFDIDMQFNTYQRTQTEFEAPFKTSPLWSSVQSKNVNIDCSYYAKYLIDREKLGGEQTALEVFSKSMTSSVRAFSESRVEIAFRKRGVNDAVELKEKLDNFFQRLQEECLKNPEDCHMDFKINYLVAHRAL